MSTVEHRAAVKRVQSRNRKEGETNKSELSSSLALTNVLSLSSSTASKKTKNVQTDQTPGASHLASILGIPVISARGGAHLYQPSPYSLFPEEKSTSEPEKKILDDPPSLKASPSEGMSAGCSLLAALSAGTPESTFPKNESPSETTNRGNNSNNAVIPRSTSTSNEISGAPVTTELQMVDSKTFFADLEKKRVEREKDNKKKKPADSQGKASGSLSQGNANSRLDAADVKRSQDGNVDPKSSSRVMARPPSPNSASTTETPPSCPKKETHPSRKAPTKKTSSTLPESTVTVTNATEKATVVVPTSVEKPSPSASPMTTTAILAVAEPSLVFSAKIPSASGKSKKRADAPEEYESSLVSSSSTTTAILSSASPAGSDLPAKSAETSGLPVPSHENKRKKNAGPAASNGNTASIAPTKKVVGPTGITRMTTAENSMNAPKKSSAAMPKENAAKHTVRTTMPTVTRTAATASASHSGIAMDGHHSSVNDVQKSVEVSVHNGEKKAKDTDHTGEGGPLLLSGSSSSSSSVTREWDVAGMGSKSGPTKAAVANASTPSVPIVGASVGTAPAILQEEDHPPSDDILRFNRLPKDVVVHGTVVHPPSSCTEMDGAPRKGRKKKEPQGLPEAVGSTIGKTDEARGQKIAAAPTTAPRTVDLETAPTPIVMAATKEKQDGGNGEERQPGAEPIAGFPFPVPRYHHLFSRSPPIGSHACSPPSLHVNPCDPMLHRGARVEGRQKGEEEVEKEKRREIGHTRDGLARTEDRDQSRRSEVAHAHTTLSTSPLPLPSPTAKVVPSTNCLEARRGQKNAAVPCTPPHSPTLLDRGAKGTPHTTPLPWLGTSIPVREENRGSVETKESDDERRNVAMIDWEAFFKSIDERNSDGRQDGKQTHAIPSPSQRIQEVSRAATTSTAMHLDRPSREGMEVASSSPSFRHSPYTVPSAAPLVPFPSQGVEETGKGRGGRSLSATKDGSHRSHSPLVPTTVAALFGAMGSGNVAASSFPPPVGGSPNCFDGEAPLVPVVSHSSGRTAHVSCSTAASSRTDAGTPDLRASPGRSILLSSLFPSDPGNPHGMRSTTGASREKTPPHASVLPLIGVLAPSSVHGPDGSTEEQRTIASWVIQQLGFPPSPAADVDSFFVRNNFLLTAFEKTAEEESLGYRIPIDNFGATTPIIRTLPYLYPPSKDGVSGGRLVIVGDVHGCAEQLEALLQKIRFDVQVDRLVMVGDLVNKGPDSMGVVRVCQKYKAVGVLGNHDMTLVDFCAANRKSTFPHSALKDPVKRIAQSFPLDCEMYLRQMPHIIRIPQYNLVVVHAGIDPRRGLEEQTVYNVLHMRRIAVKASGGDEGGSPSGESRGTVERNSPAFMFPVKNADTPVSLAMSTSLSASPLQGVLPSSPDSSAHPITRSGKKGFPPEPSVTDGVIVKGEEGVLWGKLYNGPEMIIFGHAAQISYQQHPFAIGLDTGCVYGNALTCVIFSPMSKSGVFAAVQGFKRQQKPPSADTPETSDACAQHLLLPAEAVERSIARPMTRMSPAIGTPYSLSFLGGGSGALLFPSSSPTGKNDTAAVVEDGQAASPLSYPMGSSARQTPSLHPFLTGKSDVHAPFAALSHPTRAFAVGPGSSPLVSFSYNPEALHGERCTPVSLFASPSTSSVAAAMGQAPHFSPLQEKNTHYRPSPLRENSREMWNGSSATTSASFSAGRMLLSRPPLTMTPSSLSTLLQQHLEPGRDERSSAPSSLDFPRCRQHHTAGDTPHSLSHRVTAPLVGPAPSEGNRVGGTPFTLTDTMCNKAIFSSSDVSPSSASLPSSSPGSMNMVVASTLLTLAVHQQYSAVARLLEMPNYDAMLDQLLDDACDEDAEDGKQKGKERENVGDTSKKSDGVSSSIVSLFWLPLLERLLLVRPSPDASCCSPSIQGVPSETSTRHESCTSMNDVTELLLFALHACDKVNILRKSLLPSLSLLANAATKEESQTRKKETCNDMNGKDNHIFLPQSVVKYAQMLLKD